jgi:hypothetical protein
LNDHQSFPMMARRRAACSQPQSRQSAANELIEFNGLKWPILRRTSTRYMVLFMRLRTNSKSTCVAQLQPPRNPRPATRDLACSDAAEGSGVCFLRRQLTAHLPVTDIQPHVLSDDRRASRLCITRNAARQNRACVGVVVCNSQGSKPEE